MTVRLLWAPVFLLPTVCLLPVADSMVGLLRTAAIPTTDQPAAAQRPAPPPAVATAVVSPLVFNNTQYSVAAVDPSITQCWKQGVTQYLTGTVAVRLQMCHWLAASCSSS
eukprot:COSAG01_NODE_13899_length_1520_cov_1.408867_1_plen_110_part_00